MSYRLALLGLPTAHSASPAFQNAALRALSIDGAFDAVDVDDAGMRRAADDVRAGRLHGANITAPHKHLALELADLVSEQAEAIGAANVWVRTPDGRLIADNTDWIGLEAALAATLPRGFDRRHAVILGAGGAARAAAFVLSRVFERVTVAARDPQQARALAVEIVFCELSGDAIFSPHRWPRSAYTRRRTREHVGDAALVVNASSAQPAAGESPFRWFPFEAMLPGAVALDLAYSCAPSDFVASATKAGLVADDGAVMLLHQGAAAFHRFVGQPAPLDVMRDALAAALGRPPTRIATKAGPLRRDPFVATGQIVPAAPSESENAHDVADVSSPKSDRTPNRSST